MTFREIVEYDQLSVVSDLPVVWEVKFVKQAGRRGGERGRESLNAMFQDERIEQIFTPLQELYQRDSFGYVVVVPRDKLHPESPVQQAFQARGGIIAPISVDLEDFRKDIHWIRAKHGF